VFLTQHGGNVLSQMRNIVILQCYDADDWVTGRASDLQKSTAKTISINLFLVTGLTWSNISQLIFPLTSPLRFPLSPLICPPPPFSPLSPPFPFSPSLHFPPLEVGPLNPAKGSGAAVSSPSGVWGSAPAEIEFGAF